MSSKQGFNPYLPSWEYIPDGEPHVFGDRVYLYGSHDRFNGYAFCLNDYVCYSAPVSDLTDWRCEGVIYTSADDPRNEDGDQCLYAPDVCRGADGRYYLYYVLDASPFVSVAVCDTPAGRYQFYGYVKDREGGILGERAQDEPMFDPAVLFEGGVVYLYGGFCPQTESLFDGHSGAMVTVLESDMVTIREEPRFVLPSVQKSAGSGYEGHEYFEGPSIRRAGDLYYLVYSSIHQHELCYATAVSPLGPFHFRGTVVSNVDEGLGTYKAPERQVNFPENNHGGIEKVGDAWYVFYHRHTNGNNLSRQGCLEPIRILEDGRIEQAEITSCGPNGGPLEGNGTYPAYIVCNLVSNVKDPVGLGVPGKKLDARYPFVTQDGKDGDQLQGYVANMDPGTAAGYKYFNCQDTCVTSVVTRGWSYGEMEILTSIDGESLGSIPIGKSNEWKEWKGCVPVPDGVQALYIRFKGRGCASLYSFTLSSVQK